MDRLAEINNTLSTQWGRLQNIKDTVDNTEDLAERSNNRIQDAEKIISNARTELEKAKENMANVVGSSLQMTYMPLKQSP